MKVDVSFDILGRRVENITLNDDELKAMSEAHEIIAERGKEMGITWNARDVEYHEWRFLGILRSEGIEKLLDYARNVPIVTKKIPIRSYS